jgi:hypothetical protein
LVLDPLTISEEVLAKKSNKAKQIIAQAQTSKQNSQVISGGYSIGSGNNINLQFQTNTGSNGLAQFND